MRDTGIGVTAEDRERIFEKFFRSDESEVQALTGHGLGLSLTKDIIELHHGTLILSADYADGSEFIIELRKDAGLIKQVI